MRGQLPAPSSLASCLSPLRSRLSVLSLALRSSVLLSACYDTSGLASSGTILGFVQDASDGVAVVGATITVAGDTTRSLFDGTFRVDGVKEGTYTLVATLGNYQRFQTEVTVFARRNTAVPVVLLPVDFSIAPPAAIGVEPGPQARAITIVWLPLDEAVNYALYWSTSPDVPPTNANRINGVTSPFVHRDLQLGTTYYYAVAGLGLVSEGPASGVAFTQPRDGIEMRVDAPAIGASIGVVIPMSVRIVSDNALTSVVATLGTASAPLVYNPDFSRWEGALTPPAVPIEGVAMLAIIATDASNRSARASRTLRYSN